MKRKSISLISILVFIITYMTFSAIFNDWGNFKRGLMGAPPIEDVVNKP